MRHSSVSAFDAVLEYLESEELVFAVVEPGRAVAIELDDEEATWSCTAIWDDEDETLFFYGACGVVPPARLAAAAEYITRANSGLSVGNLEMDYDDGEVCVKTSADLTDLEVVTALIDHLLGANVVAVAAFAPGLLEVIEGRDPAEAYASVLAAQDEES